MRAVTSLALAIAIVIPVSALAGTCENGYMAEGQTPPAIDGINTTDTGFLSYYWAWGANSSDQGTGAAGLVDDGSGIAINSGIVWANSDACTGTIDGTALLVEAQTVSSGGKLAVVAIQGAEANLDFLQGTLGQSVAETIPVPGITSMVSGTDGFGDFIDVSLDWSVPTTAWDLADVSSVLAGFSVYVISASGGGPVNDGDKALFTRLQTTSGIAPFITNDSDTADGLLPAAQPSCDVRIRAGDIYYFALALILDGSGDAGGEPQADASAVETTYVSACSAGASGDPTLFADGFESGDTTAWSSTVP